MVPVENCDSETLFRVMEDKIEPGTIIISDCWRAYNCFSERCYQHLTVNHSLNFVDPSIKEHTNTIERLWREVKNKVPLYGRKKKHFVSYLARSMFIMAHKDPNRRFHGFLQAAASVYKPDQSTE